MTMAKPTLSSYIRNDLEQLDKKQEPGPFVTISRQYGCDGYELGDLLLKKLNEREDGAKWRLFKKEILKQLAEDTGLTEEVIEKERLSKPSLLKDLLRGVRRSSIPDGYEIRNKITLMVRTVAFEGHAIIIGQSGTAATGDLDNGLSVRLEASKEWRIARVSLRENLKRQAATARIEDVERQRKHLRKIYEQKNPREPAFNLVIDNSMFTIEQAVEMILFVMEQKKLIAKSKQD
jgi:cytidylate kinase